MLTCLFLWLGDIGLSKLRGTVKFKEDLLAIFRHLKKNPQEPDPIKSWAVVPFEGKINGKTQRIDNKRALAAYFGISHMKLYDILKKNPHGVVDASKPKTVQPESARQYQETIIHTEIIKRYAKYINPQTGLLTGHGASVDRMGENLFFMFKRDPALLTKEQYVQAVRDPRFAKADGSIKVEQLSKIRLVLDTAAQLKDVPISGYKFRDGDEFYERGLQIKGGKLELYLQEHELIQFVKNIDCIDTLVMHRLGLEAGSRISSAMLVSRENILFDLNTIVMYEPKVKKKEKRIFATETLDFINMYIRECPKPTPQNPRNIGIIGKLFERHKSAGKNYQSYNSSIRRAGFNAGLWGYQTDAKGKPMFTEKTVRKRGGGGALGKEKHYLTEGKLTTSHTTMKHTFVSLSSQHGFSIDDCARQTGTKASTLTDFYHGGGESTLLALILGKRTFVPWHVWIRETIDPLYRKQYTDLKRQGKWTISSEQQRIEEKTLSDKIEDEA